MRVCLQYHTKVTQRTPSSTTITRSVRPADVSPPPNQLTNNVSSSSGSIFQLLLCLLRKRSAVSWKCESEEDEKCFTTRCSKKLLDVILIFNQCDRFVKEGILKECDVSFFKCVHKLAAYVCHDKSVKKSPFFREHLPYIRSKRAFLHGFILIKSYDKKRKYLLKGVNKGFLGKLLLLLVVLSEQKLFDSKRKYRNSCKLPHIQSVRNVIVHKSLLCKSLLHYLLHVFFCSYMYIILNW